MSNTLGIPWLRFALLADLVKRLTGVSPKLSKSVFQHMVFIAQEAYGIEFGYTFRLFMSGMSSSQLLCDLDLIESLGAVSVEWSEDAYIIIPTEGIDSFRAKTEGEIDDPETTKDLDRFVAKFGAMAPVDIKVRAVVLCVLDDYDVHCSDALLRQSCVCGRVRDICHSHSCEEIVSVINEITAEQKK